MNFRDLVLAHAGRPVAILGAGPSLPEQFGRLPAGCVLISVNHHACALARCDYIVAIDSKPPEHRTRLEATGVPIVGPLPWATYRVMDQPLLGFSSQHAVWAAWLMGGYPILLCGMDLYRSGRYWDGAPAPAVGPRRTVESQLRSWRRCFDAVPATVRSLGGPLAELVPPYDPAELFPSYVEPERATLLKAAGGTVVQIKVATKVRGQPLAPGDVVELPTNDARRLVEQRRARVTDVLR